MFIQSKKVAVWGWVSFLCIIYVQYNVFSIIIVIDAVLPLLLLLKFGSICSHMVDLQQRKLFNKEVMVCISALQLSPLSQTSDITVIHIDH